MQQKKIGGEVALHQDSTFLYTDPPSVVGLWVALEDATKENGCLWHLPGKNQKTCKMFVLHKDKLNLNGLMLQLLIGMRVCILWKVIIVSRP